MIIETKRYLGNILDGQITDSRIGHLRLYGGFTSVYFRDESGLVEQVTLHSDKPNAALSRDSVLGGVKTLTVSENISSQSHPLYPNVKKIIVQSGVTQALLDFEALSPELDVYVPSSVQALRLPSFEYPKNIQNDKAAMEAYRIKHRVHFEWISKNTFNTLGLSEEWGIALTTQPDFGTDDLGGYLPVFGSDSPESELLVSFRKYAGHPGGGIMLTGYYGKSPIVEVPTLFRGKRVTGFLLTNDSYSYGDVSVQGVTELRLPATLTELRISNSPYQGEHQYSLSRVVYEGTKAQLRSLLTASAAEADLLQLAAVIECSDGAYTQSGGEVYTFEDGTGSLLTVQIDRPVGAGGRALVFADYTYQGVRLTGHAAEALTLNEGAFSLTIRPYPDRIEIEFFDGQSSFTQFEQISKTAADAPIAHAAATRETQATCREQGCTETYCTVCDKVLSVTDIVPALGHAPDGEPQVIAPTCTAEGYSMRMCIRCDNNVRLEDSAVPPLGHAFDMDGHCTREGCKAIEGDGTVTTYAYALPTGEPLTLFIEWQGFSTESGEFLATVSVKFVYGDLIFDGSGVGGYNLQIEGHTLDITVKSSAEIYATFTPAGGKTLVFEPLPSA